ncbi:hypothetical protein I6N90_06885 [Paenibacillus sp. GSMTC-2017]|uniref:hypothetical protein n=1 Tax=Paenibacillus sp. GSMTC-2017 TaxID=2794350 RepID=UPI0018D7D4BF|nr:hypothetical protein [Paenibacillus sp. GSMTC-2017]MBH5317541.1 hypothetical protein [Paenibacillus sp. GSMTC-2017]
MENTPLGKIIKNYASNKFTLEQIMSHFVKLTSTESSELREKYISKFVGDESIYLKYKIDTEPSTYLWNSFRSNVTSMDINELTNNFPLSNHLFMFWDYNSANHPMFNLGREFVFKISSEQLLNNYLKFPSDTYFFDESFESTLLITHEDFNYDVQQFLLLK